MKRNYLPVVTMLLITALILASCNLPKRQSAAIPTSSIGTQQSYPTPSSLCAHPYFPTTTGDKWEYSGTNSLVGAYTRSDTIATSSTDAFTLSTTQSDVTYSVTYDCSSAGITSTNPVQEYAGALLSSSNAPVSVTLTSNAGTSLPAQIAPGDTWQQTTDWEAKSPQTNLNGRFVFDYTAVGYENITVQAGTYHALHINGNIRVEITGLHILAGTYSTSTWWVPDIGLVKSEGASHVTGIDFSDTMQLTRFTPAP